MPACATTVGTDAPPFGIPEDEAGLYVSSLKVTHKKDRKELRNKCGGVFAVAHYNRTADVEIEGTVKGTFTLDVGDSYALVNTVNPAVIGKLNIDEISVDMSNEDFHKVSIKGVAYEKII